MMSIWQSNSPRFSPWVYDLPSHIGQYQAYTPSCGVRFNLQAKKVICYFSDICASTIQVAILY